MYLLLMKEKRNGEQDMEQRVVEEKRNEITAIPKVQDAVEIKRQTMMIDAMGTQKEIAE